MRIMQTDRARTARAGGVRARGPVRARGLRALAVCAALAAAAGCTGSGSEHARKKDGDGKQPAAASSSPSASARPVLPKESRFPVPDGFDNRRGWTEAVTEPDSDSHGSWAVAPAAGLLVQAVNNDGEVHARRLAGGDEAWSFTAEPELEGARTDVYVVPARAGRKDGELVVVVREGTTVEDGTARPRSVVTVDTVRAGAKGVAEAERHVEYEDGDVAAFTGALLVTDRANSRVVALDPVTGRARTVEQAGEVELPSCREEDMAPSASCTADTTAEFATAAGPVSSFTQSSYCDFRWRERDYVPCAEGFAVGSRWTTAEVAPQGAADATALAVVGPYIVVDWTRFPHADSEEDAERDVVAVHELDSGELVAKAECDITDAEAGNGSVAQLSAQVLTQLSPGGDRLISGQVGFDLSAGTGVCLADTAREKGVTLTAVDDAGRAFGVTYDASGWTDVAYGAFPHDFAMEDAPVAARTVEADLGTGAREALEEGTSVPVYVSREAGVFLRAGTLGVYPARG